MLLFGVPPFVPPSIRRPAHRTKSHICRAKRRARSWRHRRSLHLYRRSIGRRLDEPVEIVWAGDPVVQVPRLPLDLCGGSFRFDLAVCADAVHVQRMEGWGQDEDDGDGRRRVAEV
jgi:hypothetical protein